jgi:hypothetical protein
MWTIGGGIRWANFVYERVTISYLAGFRYKPALGMGEPVNLDDDEVPIEKEKAKTTKKDFSHYYSDSTAEIVTVQWNDRKCADR